MFTRKKGSKARAQDCEAAEAASRARLMVDPEFAARHGFGAALHVRQICRAGNAILRGGGLLEGLMHGSKAFVANLDGLLVAT